VCHGISSSLEVIHQLLVFIGVFAIWEVLLQRVEIVPGAHLGNCQGYDSSMMDNVVSHLPGMHGNVLDVGHQHAAPGIQGVSRIICRQLEGLDLLCQS